jgi:asparagine synthase (glutamine-hydrolysing)
MMKNGVGAPSAVLQKLAAALTHRGPDGHGVYTDDAVGLVHTRLAIVDLTGGAQPLVSSDRVALIANGEIYNDLDIRRDLPEAEFATGSDCESPLHLYRKYGEAYAGHLRGMFAIAIYDPVQKILVLTRDPFGVKPLYVADTPGGFYFASEMQALIAAGVVPARVNAAVADELLAIQFSSSAHTAVHGIQRVDPGETLVVENGVVVRRHQHEPLPPPGRKTISETDALKAFDRAWQDSVSVHRRADVPYGMFLSGGIDSSSVLAMMARQEPRAVLAYTAAFPGTAAHDERDQARSVAKAFGATHIEVEVAPNDFWTRLPEIVGFIDDPVADYAVIPSYLLAERAKADVKVILSGEGGDELFGGYGRYRAANRIWPFKKRMWAKPVLQKLDLLREKRPWRAAIDHHERRALSYQGLQASQALDIATWLPNDLLIKIDRCLMAHGIEGRVPFLDPVITAAAFALPDDLKIRGGLGKYLLRKWLGDALPSYPAMAPKRGFTVPVTEWIAAESLRLAPLVAQQPGVAELCHPAKVHDLFAHSGARRGTVKWHLLFYALWHNRHIVGVKSGGDVFDALAAK